LGAVMPGQTGMWLIFGLLMLVMAVLDLGVLNRRDREVSLQTALIQSAVWVFLALAFDAGIFFWQGPEKAVLFFTGYLVEESLSVDNLFVFLLVFSAFRVLKAQQPKLLFWGITFAIGLRLLFIAAGISLIHRVHGVIYVFGAFLIYTGVKLWIEKDASKEFQTDKSTVLKWIQKFIPVASEQQASGRYFVRRAGQWSVTPLFLALLALPLADVVFAVDSIPAILGITTDPFIVITSNVFAVLGLRALFFALAGFMQKFRYLNAGLAVVLVFVGAKMLLGDIYKISALPALAVIAGILAAAVIISILKKTGEKEKLKGRIPKE
jgi:tellurite resistance protein TerC